MAHEMTSTDHAVFSQKPAWHGLGTVVESAPTPAEALILSRLNWQIEQHPLVAVGEGGERIAIETHVANIRSDTRESLAVVTSGYTPIQNAKLAEIASALAEGGDVVRVESAGSIRSGRKVWFLLRGASFSARKSSDEIIPYILLANAHDGTQALRALFTTVRVVCSNTLHMALGERTAGYTLRHTSGISLRAEDIKSALSLYGRALSATQSSISTLSARDIKREDAQAFFTEAYSRDFDPIPSAPSTPAEKSQRERAIDAYRSFSARFDRERDISGATAWTAFNAYTGWLQHERPIRVAAPRKSEARNEYRLFGEDADRTSATFSQALSLAAH